MADTIYLSSDGDELLRMRLLVLITLVSGVFSVGPECEEVLASDREYRCPAGNGTITFAAQQDYVRLTCEGEEFTCADLPRLNIARSLSLKSLGFDSCPPSLLQCAYEAVNTVSVNHIVLTRMTAPLEEEDVKNLRGVTMLMIVQGDVQRSVPMAAINSIPTLRDLRIAGGNFQLYPNMFGRAPHIRYLEFSGNNITSIPKDTFKYLISLRNLNIFSNNITNISRGAFDGLDGLEMFAFNNNNLMYIEPGAFDAVPRLASIDMIVNHLMFLPNGLLDGFNEIINITIFMNRVDLELDTLAFSNLPILKKVNLRSCGIKKLPDNLFKNSNGIERLELSSNKIDNIPTNLLINMSRLKYLDLSSNRIKDFIDNNSPFFGLNMLEYLNLNRNNIERLSESLFSRQGQLKELHIDHNSISSIGWTCFYGASNLQTLSLSSNNLTFDIEDQGYLALENTSQLQYLTNLKILNLSNNRIRIIFEDWRTVMTRLDYLDLSNNNFTELDRNEIHFLSSSVTVDLRFNKITRLKFYPNQPVLPPEDNFKPTRKLLLGDNPIHCDCEIYDFILLKDLTYTPSGELKLNLNNLRCYSPPNSNGILVNDLSPDSLVCRIENYCPRNCSCFARTGTSEFSMDCSKLPSKLPDIYSDNVASYFQKMPTLYVNLEQQPENIANYNIHTLNLSYANFEKIDFSPTESLKILDLSHNRITKVPIEFIESNVTLYLAGNKLDCECWDADSIATLKKYSFIPDLDQVTCSNEVPISDVDVTALCKNIKATTTAILIFTVLIIAFLISFIYLRRYYNEIILCLATKCCSDCIEILKPDPDRVYDVFISFAHQDFEFVEDILLPKLEKEFKQKVCVHYRDWIIGDMIPTQIIRSVENSRKTIIVMSKSFIESDWANLEFGAAHNRALKEQKARVILIIMDEKLTKHEGLSPELKAYINTNTYLVWDDPKFWSRLNNALPKMEHKFKFLNVFNHRSNVEVPEALKNEDKPVRNGLNVRLNSQGQLINASENSDKENNLAEYV